MVVGLVVAWKWEGVSGSLIPGGAGLFGIVNGRVPLLNAVFGPTLAVNLLFLLCGWLRGWPRP
jgi:hypothetical protein